MESLLRGLAAALTLGAAWPVLAQDEAPFAPVPVSDMVPTSVDLAMRMTVPVMVNGEGPFQFVIDTGADRSVISAELADRLKLVPDNTATLHSMSGVSQVRTVTIPELQVGGEPVRNVTAPVLPVRYLGADGLLGIDALTDKRIIMDFKARTMTVVPSSRREKHDPDTIVVEARSRFGQLVLVDADAKGRKIFVIIDSGAQNTVGNTALRRVVMRRQPKIPVVPINLVSVTGGKTLADYTSIDKVRIGGVDMNNTPVAFADAHPFKKFGVADKPAMLLGMDMLRLFERVSVDFARRKVHLLLRDEDS